MEPYDLSEPVEIDTDVYWVGSAEEALLRRNIYLRVFHVGGKTFGRIVDPGPDCDFDMLKNKVEAAKKLLAEGMPPREIAHNLGVAIPTLYRWCPASER